MSNERRDEDRVEAVLASVGEHLAVTPNSVTAPNEVANRRWLRPLLAAAVTVAVLVGATLAIAPARRAVSGWFRAGRIEVQIGAGTADGSLPVFTDAVERIEPSDAEALLGAELPVLDGSALGAPSDWWTVPEGGVLIGWPDGGSSLWIVPTDGEDPVMKKALSPGNDVRSVAGLGDQAFAVAGEHVFQSPHRRVAADSVVVWEDGDLTFRLEGTADVDDLIDLARQLAAGTTVDD
jgi:hypothetical protein